MTAALACARGRLANHVKMFASALPVPQPPADASLTSWQGNHRAIILMRARPPVLLP